MGTLSERTDTEFLSKSISADEIKETINTDVVVAGAGVSGLTAALSAAEAGSRTVLIEKGPTYNVRGLHNAAIHSKLQKKAGIEINKNDLISTIMEFGGYRSNQQVVKLWADNCSTVMDWLIDLMEEYDHEVVLDPTTKAWYFPNYPLIHVFRPHYQYTLAETLLDKSKKLGVDVRFSTPAAQLIRSRNGRVTGMIAGTAESGYVRFNAAKGVVLCTGDYGGDREMVSQFCNWEFMDDLKCAYEGGLNTGDGLKMALAIGADVDNQPHCPMLFDWTVWSESGLFNVARQPWLYVDIKGNRFMNEDLPWGYECNQILMQPERKAWAIWDGKYDDEIPGMQSQCCKNMGPPTYLWNPEQMTEALKKENVLKAPMLEELAQKMNMPVDPFKATVDRYNELARIGEDLDFGKNPDRLTTLVQPPFYACKMEVRYMVILSGLKIDTRLQVLDKDRKAIPGLFAAGNVSGSFFGGDAYSTTTPGVTHSRAWTFGRLAGLNAASESPQAE